MQKRLDDNDMLMDSTYNEVTQYLLRGLWKYYNLWNMKENDSKSYLGYFKYTATIINTIIIIIVLIWLKKLNRVIKLLSFKMVIKSGLLRIFHVKVTLIHLI